MSKRCIPVILLLVGIYFPQSAASQTEYTGLAKRSSSTLREERIERLKNEILQDISLFGPSDRARYLAELSDEFWETDRVAGKEFLSESTDVVLSQLDSFEEAGAKIDLVNFVLFHGKALSRDPATGMKLAVEAIELLEEDRKMPDSERGRRLVSLAYALSDHDISQAVELAIRSLKLAKPYIDSESVRVFYESSGANEPALARYVSELMTVFRNGNLTDSERTIAILNFESNTRPFDGPYLSTELKQEFLGVLADIAERESRARLAQSRDSCSLFWMAGRAIDRFEKLLPERVGGVKAAVTNCAYPLDSRDFLGKPKPVTVDYYLGLAEKSSSSERNAFYLIRAAARAFSERDYPTAIRILQGVGPNERNADWEVQTIQATSAQLTQLAGDQRDSEIRQILARLPKRVRAHVLTRFLRPYSRRSDSLTWDLLEMAVHDFRSMELHPPSRHDPTWIVNPAEMITLVKVLGDLKEDDRALAMFSEYIDLLNKLSSKYSTPGENGGALSYFCYSSITKRILENDLESILDNVARVDSPRFRLRLRLQILKDYRIRNGSLWGPCGMYPVD